MHVGDMAREVLDAHGRSSQGFHPNQTARYLDEALAPIMRARRKISEAIAKSDGEVVVINELTNAVEGIGQATLMLMAAMQSLGVDPETTLPFVRESLKNGTALYLRQLVQVGVINAAGAHIAPAVGVDSNGFTTSAPARLEKFEGESVAATEDQDEGED